jgi:hypothetical protein
MEDVADQYRGRSARPAMLYTAEAIAEYIGVPLEATRHLIRRGVLPTFRIGRTVAARPERIDAALKEIERQQTWRSPSDGPHVLETSLPQLCRADLRLHGSGGRRSISAQPTMRTSTTGVVDVLSARDKSSSVSPPADPT